MYDTKVFTGPKMLDGKLIYNTEVEYCAYCGCEAIRDSSWDDYTEDHYIFCNCDVAQAEKQYQEMRCSINNEYREELRSLKQTYENKGVITGE